MELHTFQQNLLSTINARCRYDAKYFGDYFSYLVMKNDSLVDVINLQ